MSNTNKKSRRNFIKHIAGSALISGATPGILLGNPNRHSLSLLQPGRKFNANENIQIVVIGMGIQGFANAQNAVNVPGVKLIGACDLYQGRLDHTREVYGNDIFTTKSYQEVLDRDDVDAVFIATTDHWHDKISIAAMEKGKAVYCEKPMVHHLEEGQAVIDTQKKTGAVFQVGSQRVSSIVYEKAKELFDAGELGQLVLAEIWYDRHSALGAWQYSIPPDASKATIDWKTFLGDAPEVPFDPVRFFRWRNYQAYGTGVAGDLFVHLFSGLHLITSSLGPTRIYGTGGLRFWKDGRDVPDVVLGSYDYPETTAHPAFNVQMRVNFVDGSGGGSQIRLVGSDGVLVIGGNSVKLQKSKLPEAPGYGGWDSYNTFTEATQQAFEKQYMERYGHVQPQTREPEELEYTVPNGYNEHYEHISNFFEAVKNGKPVIEDASFGLRAAGPALATNKSYFENRIINWDPEKMKVT